MSRSIRIHPVVWLTAIGLLLVVGSGGRAAHAGAPESYSLDGRWEFARGNLRAADGYLKTTRVSGWQPISVPANWYHEGIDHSGHAWYRRSLPARRLRALRRGEHAAQTIAVLRFQGVDYAADVWVNEQHVGFHEGYFAPFELEITDALAASGAADLVVRVDSPEERAGPSWGLHKRLIKGVLAHHDTRPGGAWSHRGQEKNTGGIWEGVSLELARGVYLAPLRVAPELTFGDDGVLRGAALRIRSSARHWRQRDLARLRLRVYAPNTGAQVLEQELNTVTKRRPAIDVDVDIPQPRLWWPWSRGEQPLYRVELTALDSEGNELHKRSTKVGLRSVRRVATTGEWLINNQRLFLKGTNYIATQWKSNFSRQDYARDLQLMKDANINAVRVHAQVESSRFYDAADELGMLVWQDFPLQWGYADSPELESAAVQQVGEMVDSLGNHPAIFAWSLHNEPPWDADWMKWKYADYDAEQNRQLDDRLYQVARQADSSRYVHRVSRTQEHQWFGWYSGSIDSFAKPTSETLVSEFGAQALPIRQSLEKIIAADQIWPTTDQHWSEWEYRNFQRKETFELAGVRQPTDVDDFITVTQGYQEELILFAGAAYRAQQHRPLGALFQFMFVEDWPSINWGVVDWYRKPKPGYDALSTVYSPVLAVPVLSGRTLPAGPLAVPIRIVSDLWTDQPSVQVSAALLDDNREVVSGTTRQFSVAAPADSSAEAALWRLTAAPGKYLMRVVTRLPDQPPVELELKINVGAEDDGA